VTTLEPGALVVSLDLELHWGMRDHTPATDPVRAMLERSRGTVEALADLFVERSVRATWATVGFLFASSRQELEPFLPSIRPHYASPALDPYVERIGEDEHADPAHLAGSLVRRLARTEGQEIASHSFSHYYCLEPGQDVEAWRADLAAAQGIARSHDLVLTSLVLPRNQWNPSYAAATLQAGFTCIRGPQPSFGHRPAPNRDAAVRRAARLADTYVGVRPPPTTAWSDLHDTDGPYNVPASAFLRPFSPSRRRLQPLKLARITAGLRDAARHGRIFHLWWHPHNFTPFPGPNMDLLRRVLDEFAVLSEAEGMRSLSMRDVAVTARRG